MTRALRLSWDGPGWSAEDDAFVERLMARHQLDPRPGKTAAKPVQHLLRRRTLDVYQAEPYRPWWALHSHLSRLVTARQRRVAFNVGVDRSIRNLLAAVSQARGRLTLVSGALNTMVFNDPRVVRAFRKREDLELVIFAGPEISNVGSNRFFRYLRDRARTRFYWLADRAPLHAVWYEDADGTCHMTYESPHFEWQETRHKVYLELRRGRRLAAAVDGYLQKLRKGATFNRFEPPPTGRPAPRIPAKRWIELFTTGK